MPNVIGDQSLATIFLNSSCTFKLFLLNLIYALDSYMKIVKRFSYKTGSQSDLKKLQLITMKNSHTFPAQ